VIDELKPTSLRRLLAGIDKSLHQSNDVPPNTLNSRNLLQRVILVAVLIENFQPELTEIPKLVMQAEGKAKSADTDLQAELEQAYKRVRDEIGPLAYLYDMRTHGGLAHHPNVIKAAAAAAKLGLPEGHWHRADYLRLLNFVTDSVSKISKHLDNAVQLKASY
jgi:hypothetical protein